mgnify:CR=1 FL=1
MMEDVTLILGDENTYNLIEGETPEIHISITVKKDYSGTVSKIRNRTLINDVEKALLELQQTEEFKKLIDSYGIYTMTDIINEDPNKWRKEADRQVNGLMR